MFYKHSINCAFAFCNCVCFTSYLAVLVSLYVQVKQMFLLFMCDLIYWFADFKGPCLNVTVTTFAIHTLFMSICCWKYVYRLNRIWITILALPRDVIIYYNVQSHWASMTGCIVDWTFYGSNIMLRWNNFAFNSAALT
jgi:hypothetical protein